MRDARMQAEPPTLASRTTAMVSGCVFVTFLVSALVLLAPFPPLSTGPQHNAAGVLLRRLQHLGSGGSDPDQEMVLHMSTGHVFRDQGSYSQAIKHYEKALNLASQLGGGGRLVPVLQALGRARFDQGRFPEARHDLESALVLSGADGEHKVNILRALGNVRRDMGNIEEALKLYQQAWVGIAARNSVLAEFRPLLATDMGDAYAQRGELDKAITYFQQALEQQPTSIQKLRRPLVSEDLDTARTYCLLGGAYHFRGSVSQAMELYKKASRIQATALRPGHPDIVATQLAVARGQRDLGDTAAALATVDNIERTLRAGNHEGPDISRVLVAKADCLREGKRYAEAEASIKIALTLQRECFGGDPHPEVAVALSTYGSVLHDQGKLTEARDQYSEALRVNMQTVGLQHPETAATHNSLGTLYQDAGSHDSALIHFTKSLEIQAKTVGNESPDVANTYNNLATILYQQGSLEDAAQLLRQALKIMDGATVPKANPNRAVYAENLAEILKDLEKPPSSSLTDLVESTRPTRSLVMA